MCDEEKETKSVGVDGWIVGHLQGICGTGKFARVNVSSDGTTIEASDQFCCIQAEGVDVGKYPDARGKLISVQGTVGTAAAINLDRLAKLVESLRKLVPHDFGEPIAYVGVGFDKGFPCLYIESAITNTRKVRAAIAGMDSRGDKYREFGK